MCKTIISILLSIIFFNSCNRPQDLTEDEVYSILNEIIQDDSLFFFEICHSPLEISYSKEYGMTEDDENFIARQKKLFASFEFSENRIKPYYWNYKHEYVRIDSVCNITRVDRLSFPLISIDRKKVVFKHIDNGIGGSSGEHLYVKQKNGKWKHERYFNYWIEY